MGLNKAAQMKTVHYVKTAIATQAVNSRMNYYK